MSEQQIDKKQISELDTGSKENIEVDLMEILYRVITNRRILYKAAGIGLVIGVIVAFSIPKEYTVKVTLSPEMGNSKGSNGLAGLAASFLGNNATIGESVDALNVSLSTDIVSSTPFLLELFDMNISVSEEDTMTLESYLSEQSSPWWNYIIGFPNLVVGGVKILFTEKNNDYIKCRSLQNNTIVLTKKESDKINFLRKNIVATMNKKTAITSITVTLQNPKVAAVVADSVIYKLQKYIIGYRTSKAIEDCAYLEKLFKERQNEYYEVQQKYANYVDTHDNLILQSVRAEQERLQNDMNLAYQVYSQVANQLQVARAKVQEEKPVFAIVEPAVVPLQPSSPGIFVRVFLFVFIAIISVICWILFGKKVWMELKTEYKIFK